MVTLKLMLTTLILMSELIQMLRNNPLLAWRKMQELGCNPSQHIVTFNADAVKPSEPTRAVVRFGNQLDTLRSIKGASTYVACMLVVMLCVARDQLKGSRDSCRM